MLLYTPNNPQKAPSLKESLAQKKQETDKALDRYRLDDHNDLTNAELRVGSPMSHTEFITRVEQATGRKVWAEDSYRDKSVVGFYKMGRDKLTGEQTKQYICSFEKGYLPEYSVILTDDRNMPIKERRGWRTVLTRLLQTDSIKMFQIRNKFELREHAADERWRANTQNFKG